MKIMLKYSQDMAYRYGQNIGIAFQLVDDWLDFVSSADLLGKIQDTLLNPLL